MSDLLIRQLDPAAPSFLDDVARWHAAYLASDTHQRTDVVPWRIAEIFDLVGTPTGHRWCGAWVASRAGESRAGESLAGEVVATGLLDLPQADNLHLAQLEVQVVPEARRQGIGSAVLLELEDAARALGRSVAVAEISYGLDGPDDGAGTAGAEFARRHGYTFALGDVQRRLALPVDGDLLERLAASAAPHRAAYRLVSFQGPVPEQYVAGYAALAASLVVEAPLGALEMEREDPSVAGWRSREGALRRQGLTPWHTVALAGDEVVAYSTITVSAHDRELCHQWGTLVRPDHRGHRLGLAVKVANHQALQASGDVPAEVVTWNAAVNETMIAVNDLLGFHRTGRLGEVQKRL